MKITLLLLAVVTFVGLLYARDIPNRGNPSLEYELVNPSQPQPIKPVIESHPHSGNKTFVYDPVAKTWTEVKPTDGEPKEGTLLWNQNNDKYL